LSNGRTLQRYVTCSATARMSTQISLERIVALRVAVSWNEAVAVAQQVGRKTRANAAVRVGLDNCLLSTSGAIHVAGPSHAPFAGDATGATLAALLDRAKAPRELLVLLARWEGSSSEDINADLEFFERPDATTLAAALASRALTIEAEEAQLAEIERLRVEAGAHQAAQPVAAVNAPRIAPWALGGIAVVGIAASAALALAVARAEAPGVATNTTPGVPANMTPVQELTGRLESFVGRGLAVLGFKGGALPSAPSNGTKPASAPPERSGASPSPGSTRSAPLVVIVPPEPPASPIRGTVEILEQYDFPVEDDVVHDAGETEVQPPVLRWPQLRHVIERTPITADTPYLELVINDLGTVDKVQLRTAHTSYHERMLVSAAKAWVFYPATKNGRPVKYRMKVPIVSQ
jgi:hypothetical protein